MVGSHQQFGKLTVILKRKSMLVRHWILILQIKSRLLHVRVSSGSIAICFQNSRLCPTFYAQILITKYLKILVMRDKDKTMYMSSACN